MVRTPIAPPAPSQAGFTGRAIHGSLLGHRQIATLPSTTMAWSACGQRWSAIMSRQVPPEGTSQKMRPRVATPHRRRAPKSTSSGKSSLLISAPSSPLLPRAHHRRVVPPPRRVPPPIPLPRCERAPLQARLVAASAAGVAAGQHHGVAPPARFRARDARLLSRFLAFRSSSRSAGESPSCAPLCPPVSCVSPAKNAKTFAASRHDAAVPHCEHFAVKLGIQRRQRRQDSPTAGVIRTSRRTRDPTP